MKHQLIFSTIVSMLCGIPAATADTITLKDGTVLEGKILPSKGDVYVIEYNVNKAGTIKDTRRVPKADVAKIVEVRVDEIAFGELAKLVPTPDLLTAEEYAARIQSVRAFLTKYPTSTKTKEAKALIAKLTEEAKVVDGGGRKVDGLMISGTDYRANAYDMDARMLEGKIRQAEKAGKPIEVLRAFTGLDTDFQASASYRAVVPQVVKTLRDLRTKVVDSLSTFDARMEKQEKGLEGMSGSDQANVKQALKQQADQLEARYQAEKAANQQWVTPSSSHRQSLEDCASLIESELTRLTGAETGTKAADPGKAYRDAWKAIRAGGEVEAIEKAIADAQAAGLPEKYTKMLEESAKAEGIKIGGGS